VGYGGFRRGMASLRRVQREGGQPFSGERVGGTTFLSQGETNNYILCNLNTYVKA
jgi:hypothetical protein